MKENTFDKLWEIFSELEFMEQSDFVMGLAGGLSEFALRVILYPLAAIAIYKLCKNAKIKMPILSIIPIFNMIYLVRLIKNVNIFGKKLGGIFLIIILLICSVFRNPIFETGVLIFTTFSNHALVGVFSIVGDVISNFGLVFLFVYLLALHKLWEMYIPKSAACYLILATLFPWIVPILLFRIRNKQQVTSKLVIDYDSDGTIDEEVAVHQVEKEEAEKGEAENVEAENIEVENVEVENIEAENVEVENVKNENTEVKSDKKKKKLFSFRKNK